MDIVIVPVLNSISLILGMYQYLVFAYVILGWLEFFKIVNPYSNVIYSIHNFLFAIVEPALNQIRRLLPFRLSVDISPVVLLVVIYFVQDVLHRLAYKIT